MHTVEGSGIKLIRTDNKLNGLNEIHYSLIFNNIHILWFAVVSLEFKEQNLNVDNKVSLKSHLSTERNYPFYPAYEFMAGLSKAKVNKLKTKQKDIIKLH